MPSSVLHRSLVEKPFTVVSAEGQFLHLSDGRKILDACGGAAVSCLGHCDPRVASAIAKQLSTVDYIHSGIFTTPSVEELSSLALRDQTTFTHALFVGSGSEAMESALKLCRQYFIEVEGPETQRFHFISRKQSFHGNTLGALGIGGHTFRRALFEPLLEHDHIHHISPCYAYRHQTGSEEDYENSLIQELIDTIEKVGGEKVAGFVFEPIVGAALGCVPATEGYMEKVRAVCNKYGILMVCDEVMCGMGRCSDGRSLHAWKSMHPDIPEDQVAPDIQTIGKGLGGGYVPIAAVLASQKIASALASGSGGFRNGFTYQAHPICCAGAVAVQKIIIEDRLLSDVADLGQILEELLFEKVAPLPHVGNIRGRGLFWGIEFVQDKDTKKPFAKVGAAAAVAAAALQRGVQVYVCEGVADGIVGDAIIVAPAYTCIMKDIRFIVDVVAGAITASF